MNAKDINFSYRVRHALTENLDHLPSETLTGLAKARSMALSHKKKDAPVRVAVVQRAFAGPVGVFIQEPLSWLARTGLMLPAILLVIGLTGLYQHAAQQRIIDMADIDAAVLSDELPLTAYLDHGFNAFLATQAD